MHGKFIMNEFKLEEHIMLESDYDVVGRNIWENKIQHINELYVCPNYNYSTQLIPADYIPYKYVPSEIKLNKIPNLINEVTFNMDKREDSSDINEVMENIFYVIVPILFIVFMLWIIVRCKRKNISRLRYSNNISVLKTSSSLSELERLSDSSSSSTRIINSLI